MNRIPILPNDYIAKMGTEETNQVSQQGFPNRAYWMLHIPESIEGTAQLFTLWLPDCPKPLFEQAIQIPVSKSLEPVAPNCSVDLNAEDCKAAGGSYQQVGRTGKFECICP